jgi:hypothetical protein
LNLRATADASFAVLRPACWLLRMTIHLSFSASSWFSGTILLSAPTLRRIYHSVTKPLPIRSGKNLAHCDSNALSPIPQLRIAYMLRGRQVAPGLFPLPVVRSPPTDARDLSPKVRAAFPALGPPPRVQRVALRAGNVHGAREELSDDGAETQNAHHERDIHQRLAHKQAYSFQLSALSIGGCGTTQRAPSS